MNFFNLGLPEIIFIVILAIIIFGPNNMVKSAREAGVFIRKLSKSPYWQEAWATKKDLDELPKILAKEAKIKETIQDLDNRSRKMSSKVNTTLSEILTEINSIEGDLKNEMEGLTDQEKENAAIDTIHENKKPSG